MKQGKMWAMGPTGQEQFVPETLAAAIFMDEGGTKTLPEALDELADGVVGPIGPIGPVGPDGPPGPPGADGHTPTLAEIGAAAAAHTHTKANVTDFAHVHPLGELSGVTPAAIGASAPGHTHTKANVTDFAHTHPLGELSGVTPAAIGASAPGHTHTKANITDFPTTMAPTAHNHTKANITDFPAALYPLRVGGVQMNMNWSGQAGQPSWLWGGEDGTNMYVYNPANFNVNSAVYHNGLAVHAGVNNEANKVVRTDGNGYINAGWINTISGTSGAPVRIYCSQDAYLRYLAPSDATLRRSLGAYITRGTGAPSGGSDGDIYIKYA